MKSSKSRIPTALFNFKTVLAKLSKKIPIINSTVREQESRLLHQLTQTLGNAPNLEIIWIVLRNIISGHNRSEKIIVEEAPLEMGIRECKFCNLSSIAGNCINKF